MEGKEGEKLLQIIDKHAGAFSRNNFYGKYLNALRALLEPPAREAPSVMTREPWRIKSCQTVLGGWVQFRHTWTLHAKSNVHVMGLTRLPSGFVEPMPEFYARLGELVDLIHAFLLERGALDRDLPALANELRLAAKFFESKEADKDPDWLKQLSLEEQTRLSGAVSKASRLLEVMDIPGDPEKDEKKVIAHSVAQLRLVANRLERGSLPSNPRLIRRIEEIDPSLAQLWKKLSALCQRLETLAHKQLRGIQFGGRDNHFITSYGKELAAVMLYGGNSYSFPRDDAPRVASVFTNPKKEKHLHAAIGRAQAFFVLYPVGGTEVLCRGAVMPYYEFLHPEILDDATWQALLNTRPPVPNWVNTIISPATSPQIKKE